MNLDEIRQKTSLITLAEAAGARFGDKNHLRSHCPLPRHTGDRSSLSFVIYDNGRRWKCHSSCPSDASGGDVISFYMAWKGVDFKMAIQELADNRDDSFLINHPPTLPVKSWVQPQQWRNRAEDFIAHAEKNLDESVKAYLRKERGLSEATTRAFRIGYNPQNIYEDPARWGMSGKKIWLPRGIVIPGFWQDEPRYIKIRRPLENDALGSYIPAWQPRDGFSDVKFGGPRGGKSVLFRLELLDHLPILILVEGEWDAMLLWEQCADLCDVGTLGGAQAKFDVLDLSMLTVYPMILVVHDDDTAGSKGRAYISNLQTSIPRLRSISPPAHDLTDFWKSGGDLRGWVAKHVSNALEEVLGWTKTQHPQAERCHKILSNILHYS